MNEARGRSSPWIPDPPTPATQEVRFATAMTGGVSLAIWMGGVAREVNLLDQASREREADSSATKSADPADRKLLDRYGRLLDLLDQTVRIDVLSGTSAGGINAAVLGLCHACGQDMGWLRDVWLRTGDLDALLRDPADATVPSLLRGDEVLLKQLEANLSSVPEVEELRDTTVFITTTLLSGETGRFTDSYGTQVPDVSHLGVFHFDQDALNKKDKEKRSALALAARSSASFPVAFEPAFLPFDRPASAQQGGPSERPPMRDFIDITRSHWAADGGLLANRPLAPVLDEVFKRPATEREVRRVLLYVVPDPGGVPTLEESPVEETIDKPDSMVQTLSQEAVAATNQSIAREMREIQDHNRRVSARRDTRLRILEMAKNPAELPSEGAWQDYLDRQGGRVVEPIVRALMREVSTLPNGDLQTLGWAQWLGVGSNPEQACTDAARTAVTESWLQPRAGSTIEELATLGRAGWDGTMSIVLYMIRQGYACTPSETLREQLTTLGPRVHAASPAAAPQSVGAFVQRAVAEEKAKRVTVELPKFAARLASTHDQGVSDRAMQRSWGHLGKVVAELAPVLQEIVNEVPESAGIDKSAQNDESAQRERRQAADRLGRYLEFLGDGKHGAAEQCVRLAGLFVTERSVISGWDDVEQSVEFVQLSAATRSLLDSKRTTAADKLTGTQFHHFGAFYKPSWRANDWMWGRIDGAGWLVHVLLQPARILTVMELHPDRFPLLKEDKPRAQAFLRALAAVRKADDQAGQGCSDDAPPTEAELLEKLAFLDDPEAPLPASLPTVALWLASAWQQQIAASELPVVAQEALATPTRRDQTWAVNVLEASGQAHLATAQARRATAMVSAGRPAKKLRAEPAPPPTPPDRPDVATLINLLRDPVNGYPVPDENLGEERGEPLFTKTAAHAAAVVTAAATSVEGAPATVNTMFTTARTATLTGYRAANTVGFWPRRMLLAGAGLTALGVLFSAIPSPLWTGLGFVALLGGLWLIALGAWGTSKKVFAGLMAGLIIALLFATTAPGIRGLVLGTGDDAQGWVADTALPWLRERWWSLLAITLLILGVVALADLAVRQRHRKAST
ncbi:MAG: patatin-like protein [Candidatus Nanopelagicales bacterium]